MAVARKLTAILVADVAGFSRLMREDEAATYDAVRHLRDETLPALIAPHDGRLIKDLGDGFLVTFDSAVQAVECGVALQQAMSGYEMLELRVGVNLGDVLVEENDVFGDGVNVAARLEAICTPGGVAMSENVYEQVRDKLDLVVDTLEPQQLKNIDRPVGVRLWKGRAPVASGDPDLSLPVKPSIAVLAFVNMSSDPEQEFFAEGIAEDIITALSRIERFFVVARTSSFSFKGQNVDVKEIGEALGVRYVLEGSVRAAGGRLRVTAQLIEAATGRHIWAEKYDRMAEDVFDIQDEITQNVVATSQMLIDLSEGASEFRVERETLPVWRLVNLAWSTAYELSREALATAIEYSRQAVQLEPESARANMVLAHSLYHQAAINRPDSSSELLRESLEYAERAVKLGPNSEYAYWARALASSAHGDFTRAISDLERAIEINPNCSLAHGSLGTVYARAGFPEKAIEKTNISIRSNPRDPSMFFRYWTLGLAYYLLGDFESAQMWADKSIAFKRDWPSSYLLMMAVKVASGDEDAAREVFADAKSVVGQMTLEAAAIYGPQIPAKKEEFLANLRRVGMN